MPRQCLFHAVIWRFFGDDHVVYVAFAQSGGGALVSVDKSILSGVEENLATVLKGAGGGLAWPGLLRRLDRINPGYRS